MQLGKNTLKHPKQAEKKIVIFVEVKRDLTSSAIALLVYVYRFYRLGVTKVFFSV